MAPVRTYDQVVFPHVSYQVGQVFPLFIGRIEAVLLEQPGPPLLRTTTKDTPQSVEDIGHPGRTGLDETEPQGREALRDLVGDDVPEGHQGQGAGMREG